MNYKYPDLLAERDDCYLDKLTLVSQLGRFEDGFEIDFGGIYTFSRLVFVSTGVPRYEFFAFNGQEYVSVYKGENPSNVEVCFLKPVDYAYKAKLVLYDCEIGEDRSISLMYE